MKKKADKIRKTLCLYFVQFQWGYTLPTLIPSTGRPDLTLLQCSKFSSCSHQRELYLNLLHSISLHLYLDKPHPSPLFTKRGIVYPGNLALQTHKHPILMRHIKKRYIQILLLLQQLLLPPYKKDSYFSSCYVERKMLLSSVAISSPIPYTIKKITKNAKKTL